MKLKVNDSNPGQVSAEHDPALRSEVRDDNQREYLVELGPFQPRLPCFPTNPDIPQGKQNHFSPRWYDEYPHLEYSVEKDAVFCFVCSLFDDTPSKEKADPSWKTTGSTKHIDIQLDKEKRVAQIQEAQDLEYNRQIILILLDIAKTPRQALPFRGDSNEDGNFYQLVLLLSRHVPNLKRWLTDKRLNPYHVTYLSPQSQNEFIMLLEKELRGKVIEEVKCACMFSVMADTTPDEEHTDRLSVVLRYVSATGKPTERLLDLSKTEDKTGLGQAQDILSTIKRCGLNTDSLCFQSYDFAAAMSGEFNGAQKNLSELVGRHIPYIPCQAHRCNTVIEHSCNASAIVQEMFEILQALYVFFTSSTKRFQPLKDEITKVENCLMLRNLSKTRWSARAEKYLEQILLRSMFETRGFPIDRMIDNLTHALIDKEKLRTQLDDLPTILGLYNVEKKKKITSISRISTIADIFNSLPSAKKQCLEVHTMIKLYYTMPLTSASCERTFSAMRRLKT
ncbi:zinc finger MYM-type 1-like [Paramuricea clavata]|uniref:Zinc finger MYM-type 1-like n=1 Tax=Paramuricea clavata TaxID=317549 RepID=A0A7D9DMS7_PARCT|nr:zinc finger MYM-type 1-like [Paramuricea clavata]